MTAELLISASDLNNQTTGEVVDVKPEGHIWGTREQPPGYVHFTITGATVEQVLEYIGAWDIDFLHTLVNQNAAGWRYRIEVDPIYISASDVGKTELKAAMQDHVEGGSEYWEGSVVVSFTTSSMTVDIPKNGVYQTAEGLTDVQYLKLLRDDFRDIFMTQLDQRRYYFAQADVDTALANNGELTMTKAEAQAAVIDKLTE